LKAYRAVAGFDDAFVAASSKKAALLAWGAKKDLFALGAAELVDQREAPKEVFDTPGDVMLRSRGSLADQLKAAGAGRSPKTNDLSHEDVSEKKLKRAFKKPRRKKKPAPSRAALEAAEAELADVTQRREQDLAAIEKPIAALETRKRIVLEGTRAVLSKLKAKVVRQSDRYHSAREEWAARE
jgi:hypothetical protein